jgi:hypothetical protein
MQVETAAGRKKQMEDEVKAQIEMVANFQNFTKELTKSTASEVNAAAATLGQIIDDYGKGFARATAEAILFGDVSGKTFKQATGEILKSLAIEATVQSLMKGAQALAMFFVNPVEAGNLAASAAAYGAAAAAARVLAWVVVVQRREEGQRPHHQELHRWRELLSVSGLRPVRLWLILISAAL